MNQETWKLLYKQYDPMILFLHLNYFFTVLRAQGAMEFEHLRNNVILECEKTEEKLMSRWVLYSFQGQRGRGIITLAYFDYDNF